MSRGPIHIVAVGPVATGSRLFRMGGVLRAAVFVKATFALVPEGRAEIVGPDEVIEEDRLAPPVQRAEVPVHAVAAAAENAPYLPNAGVILVGTAHAPLGLPTPAMAVRLAIYRGDRAVVDKLLHVFGDRTASAPTPAPLRSMPLRYERAYGGAGFDDNPVGVGAALTGPLPNVVDPADRQRPAGFGPIPASWGQRLRLLGDAAPPALELGVFTLSDDLDFRQQSAAPLDQQCDVLHGDEWLVLDGLHPTLPRLRSQLPGAVARARFTIDVPWKSGPARPLSLVADTLVIDADHLRASLIWRGQLTLDDADGAARLHVQAGLELPGEPIVWPAAEAPAPEIPSLVEEETTTGTKEVVVAAARDASPITLALPDLTKLDETTGDVYQTTALDVADLRGRAIAPFALAPPGAGAEPKAATIPGAPWSREPAARPPAIEGDVTTGVRIPPEMLAAARREAASDPPARLGRAESPWSAGLAPQPAVVGMTPVARAVTPSSPPGALPAPPPLLGPIALKAAAPSAAAPPTSQPPPAPDVDDPARRAWLERIEKGDSLDGLDAEGADLHDVDLAGRSLVGAKLAGVRLAGARLVGATLNGADLARADLTGADLEGAKLGGANLAGAILVRARLDRAELGDASFAGARASDATFEAARGKNVDFSSAKLERASFVRAELEAVDLRGASIAGAHFEAALLPGAELGEATGEGAVFDGARLLKAKAAGASLPRATFRQADLGESIWERAKLPKASFEGATLRGASFVRASCADAIFADAEMSRADLQRMVADRADFRGASLDGADLRKLSAPESKWIDVAMHRAQADKANLTRATLTNADLRGTSLRTANLAGANLARARLEGVDLRDADLTGAVLRGASREGANFSGATLAGVEDDVRKI